MIFSIRNEKSTAKKREEISETLNAVMATLVTKGNPNEKNAGKFFCTFWEGGDPILSAENRYTSYDDNSDTSRIEWKGNDIVSFFTDRSQGTRILMKNYPLDPVPYFEGRRKDRIFGK